MPGDNEPPTSLEDQEDGDDELWDGPRWRLPELQWPQLGNLQERIRGSPAGACPLVQPSSS